MMHIIGTAWRDGVPWLRVAIDGTPRVLPPEGRFDWELGARTCIGYWDDSWRPCPDQAPVGHDRQCLLCFRGRGDPRRRDDQPECVFEPKCKDNRAACVCSFGGVREPVPHVVYLAFYGKLAKVGMTMERRVKTRLREQGADAYLVVTTLPDRAAARAEEQRIAALTGLPEWRRHDEVLPQWARAPDRAAIEAAAMQWGADLAGRYPVGSIQHLQHAPPLPGVPRRVATEGRHRGEWVGARGGHLFYAVRQGLDVGVPVIKALRRNDLIGRWVSAAAGQHAQDE